MVPFVGQSSCGYSDDRAFRDAIWVSPQTAKVTRITNPIATRISQQNSCPPCKTVKICCESCRTRPKAHHSALSPGNAAVFAQLSNAAQYFRSFRSKMVLYTVSSALSQLSGLSVEKDFSPKLSPRPFLPSNLRIGPHKY